MELVVLNNDEARLNITWSGSNGELDDPVPFGASDAEIKAWASEAIRGGSVRGIEADQNVDFADFRVDRFPATEDVPFNRLMLRFSTPFGMTERYGVVHSDDFDSQKDGWGEDCYYLVDSFTNEIVWSDAMEMEDATLARDLSDLVELMNTQAEKLSYLLKRATRGRKHIKFAADVHKEYVEMFGKEDFGYKFEREV